MLQELIQYADRNGLAGAGYSTKTVKWAIQIDTDGRCLGIAELGNPDQKRNRGREFNYCPDTPGMQSGGKSHFLVESLETVLLFGKNAEKPSTVVKHDFFVRLLREASDVLPELAHFADILDDAGQRAGLCEQAEAQKAKPSDKITLMVVNCDEPLLIEDSAWRPWWDDYRRSLLEPPSGGKQAEGERMRCFATGELIKPADTHPKITQLAGVGASSMGASLVSFDKDAFASLGLSQSAGAAMSEDAAAAYRAAIEDILAHHGYNLAGARVGYWYDKTVPPEDDPLSFLVDPGDSEEQGALARARELLDAVRTGRHPEADKYARTHYYAMTLSGNGGRVVVRDWMTGTFDELLGSINAWFGDLETCLPNSTRTARPPTFESVLTSSLKERPPSQRYQDWVEAASSHRHYLWKAAVGGAGSVLPRAFVDQVVTAHRLALLTRHVIGAATSHLKREGITAAPGAANGEHYRTSLIVTRMGVMRAHCNRIARTYGKGDYKVDSTLDVTHPRAAYHIGRLMAVLEMVQRKAQGEIGATIAQTHYASAATRPITALPRLQTLTQHHLPKIQNVKLRRQYYNLLTEINHSIKDGIPRSFDLEDQCLFHLGYYHQRAYAPYEESPHKHLTIRGEKVRSKSEVIVANLLASLGVAYRYEAPLDLKSGCLVSPEETQEADRKVIHPDFTVQREADSGPVFIEHLGMMDNFAYRGNWDRREKDYREAGILPFDEGGGPNGALVVTEEKDGVIDCCRLTEALKQLT